MFGKLASFGLHGVLGAMLGGFVATGLLLAFQPPPREKSVCLVMDHSSSMNVVALPDDPSKKTRLSSAADAARDLIDQLVDVDREDRAKSRVGVVQFDTAAKRLTKVLTQESAQVKSAIAEYAEKGDGGTNFDAALREAAALLADAPGAKFCVFVTDGEPSDKFPWQEAAAALRGMDVKIIAIGTAEATLATLEELAGVPSDPVQGAPPQALLASDGRLVEAIKDVVGSMRILTGGSAASPMDAAKMMAVWAGIVSTALSVALVMAQVRYRRRRIGVGSVLKPALGALVGGAIAGAAGQVAFQLISGGEAAGAAQAAQSGSGAFGLLLGWSVLGAVSGWIVCAFIPNLKSVLGAVAGAVGGVLGGCVLNWSWSLGSSEPSFVGPVAGAGVLGAAIGIALVLMEEAVREASLVIEFPDGERSKEFNLGEEPIVVAGRSADGVTVFVRDAPEQGLSLRLVNGSIFVKDLATGTERRTGTGATIECGESTLRIAGKTSAGSQEPTSNPAPEPDVVSPGPSPQVRTEPARPVPSAAPVVGATGPLRLRLGGRALELTAGRQLTTHDMPWLLPSTPYGAVAVVVANPNSARELGLQNLSQSTWNARTPEGKGLSIPPGRTLRLTRGSTLDIGGTAGSVD